MKLIYLEYKDGKINPEAKFWLNIDSTTTIPAVGSNVIGERKLYKVMNVTQDFDNQHDIIVVVSYVCDVKHSSIDKSLARLLNRDENPNR